MSIKENKIVHTINFFARKESNNSINRLKLMKLLWLSDRLHLWKHGRTILGDDYVAMKNGPVPSKAMNVSRPDYSPYASKYLNVIKYMIQSIDECDLTYFSKSEVNVLDEVWNEFGSLDRFELEKISHKYPEWMRNGEQAVRANTSIPMIMSDFFDVPKDEIKSKFYFFKGYKLNIENSKELYSMQSIFSEENPTY